jgi:plastocyanin
MNIRSLMALAALCAALPLAASAGQEFSVVQKGKSFSTKTLSIKVGDKVSFRNDDNFSHNVFTLSEPQPFDLGSYGQGQSKTVNFNKPGKFEIECAIHPEMQMVIQVAP